MPSDLGRAFLSLFLGFDGAYGQWDPLKPRRSAAMTIKEPVTPEVLELHFSGDMGLGIVPITAEDTCAWGVLDVDAHEEDLHVDLTELEQEVKKAKLPLVVCRSKSAGAHLFLFLKEPLAARLVQTVLKDWAKRISIQKRDRDGNPQGVAVIEIFPKQVKQSGIGNWLNLPYFHGDETNRYCWKDGSRLTLAQFLEYAESMKQTRTDLVTSGVDDHSNAPPCIQRMLNEGVPQGQRDNALVAMATYLKKKGEDDIPGALMRMASSPGMMLQQTRAVKEEDVQRVAKSIGRREYRYRCNEEPICSLCDSKTCKTRKFGITEDGPTKVYSDAVFGKLQKVLSDPPRWVLYVNNTPVEMITDEVHEFAPLRRKLMETLNIIIPPMKPEDWKTFLRELLDNLEEIAAPDDASPTAMVWAMLCEFTANVEAHADKPGDTNDLLRGIPVVMRGTPVTIGFRSQDFIAYLRRKRVNTGQGQDLWSLLRARGCSHKKVTFGGRQQQIWVKPLTGAPMEFVVPEPKVDF